MVLIDTSVWIAIFRGGRGSLDSEVKELIRSANAAVCGQIWLEFLRGFKSRELAREYENLFAKLNYLDSGLEVYRCAVKLCRELPRLQHGDAIIAATAHAHRAALMSLDKDFQDVATQGIIKLLPV